MASQLRHLQNTIAALDRPETPPPLPNASTRKHYSPARPRRPPLQTLAGQFYLKNWSPVLLFLELLLDIYFLHHGPLHPIDYPTYLIQARQFRQGERDYVNIYGPTGPLVYPGGHVIIFSIFERLFGIKGDADWPGYLPAQWIFLALQLVQTFIVHQIYRLASPFPQLDCVFFLLTIRARNVFHNGLFNDPFQTLFSYLGLLLLLKRRCTMSLTFFSLGASVKMSGLLWAPGVAAYLFSAIGVNETIRSMWGGILVQILVALPFRSHLWHYIHQSYELNRQFTWFNTLNWKFIPAGVFYSSAFSLLLLSLHIGSATYFISRAPQPKTNFATLTLLATTLFSGIVFSRSLHYSFYIWYFHMIPFLLRVGGFAIPTRFVVALLLEWAWNQWQGYKAHDEFNSCATWWGSASMTLIHLFMLWRLVTSAGLPKKKEKVLG